MQFLPEAIERYASEHTRAEPSELARLAEHTRTHVAQPEMLTGQVQGRLLKFIAQLLRPRLVVEVGMYTGYSALCLAEGLEPGGRVITCDIDPVAQRVAQAAFDASPLGSRIEVRMGPALQTLAGIEGPVDLSYIDADKAGYPVYFEALLGKTRSGGVILLDNMLLGGEVLEPRSASARAIDGLNRALVRDPRVENLLLPVRDGLQVVRKL